MSDSTRNGRPSQGGREAAYGYGEWALVMTSDKPDVEIDPARVPERFRGILEEMRTAKQNMRRGVMAEWIGKQEDADVLEERIDAIGPDDPAPADDEPGGVIERDDWPPLRLKESHKVEPFPIDVFPPPLARLCREVADSIRTAIDIPGLGMLTVAGAAIGQSVQIRIKPTWTESALLYSVVIASPGRAKTPALRLVVQPLYDINQQLCNESAERCAEWEIAKKAHDKDDSAADPGAEPPRLRAVVKDITRESLAIVLNDNPRGILCHLDEAMAWTNSWNQYKGKGTDEQFWLSNYSGDPLFVDRKGGRESIQIMHPFVAFLGGIQPKLVRKLRGEDGAENGFLHRIAFAFPDAFPRRAWTEEVVSEEAVQDWRNTIERLYAVPMKDTGDDVRPWLAKLRPEAKARFAEWIDVNGAAMDEADDEDREGAMAKAEGRLARLALILSRLRLACDPSRPLLDANGVPPVELEDVEGAILLTAYFASHAERVAGAATEGARTADALALLKWIKRHHKREFREADASKHLRRFRGDPPALSDAIRTLKEAGAIRPKTEPAIPGKRGPRPSPLHEVRPELLEAPQISGNSAN